MNTEKWTSGIDRITPMFKEAFGHLNEEQLNWKPSPDTWSIAQNIDHLIVINRSYYPIIDSVKNGTYKKSFMAKLSFVVNFFGNFIFKAVHPDRKSKIKTRPIWEPAKSNIPADILSKFEKEQQNLKQVIANSSELLDKGTVISSPLNKNIVYTLEKAFDIIVTHEERHFNQAKEVLDAMK